MLGGGCLLFSGQDPIAGNEEREKDEDSTSPALLVLLFSKGGKTYITICSRGSQKGTRSAYPWRVSGIIRPVGTFQSM